MNLPHPDSRRSGIVVALSALRSVASPACGEYPDLVALGSLAKSWGFDLVQLLPVNDTGSMSSPYTALSAFALHPLYIRLADLPESASHPGPAKKAAALARDHADRARIDYGAYRAAKSDILEELFRESRGTKGAAAWLEGLEGYRGWEAANPWLRTYALFSELKRRQGGRPWWEWTSHRDPERGLVERLWKDGDLEEGSRFFAWLQFRAEAQFRSAAIELSRLGVGILGDIPILIGKDSADVWGSRGLFRLDVSAGSPPDGENPLGQNWGFPVYDWEALAAEDYAFWRLRLAVAARYYSAYRIDHVLGFFRIWAVGERERSGYLGRFSPTLPILRSELGGLGFDGDRVRWLSRPHLPLWRLLEASGGEGPQLREATAALLDRIGNEDLFLFKEGVRGEADIVDALAAMGAGSGSLYDLLLSSWRDRALFEYEEGRFVTTPGWRRTTAWASLSDAERRSLDELAGARQGEAEALWDRGGRAILGNLASACDMLPTAEDLGAIPPFVPPALAGLGILGLRVLRWTRRWDEAGQPLVPATEWPEASVACPSVHDSSSLREWWETEADRGLVWAWVGAATGRSLGGVPSRLGPAEAATLLCALSTVASRLVVYPIQDLLSMSGAYRADDPAGERVNVPGSENAWNWGYRMPATLEAIAADPELAAAAGALAQRPRA